MEKEKPKVNLLALALIQWLDQHGLRKEFEVETIQDQGKIIRMVREENRRDVNIR